MKIIDYKLKKEKATVMINDNKLEIPMELFIIFKIRRDMEITEEEYKDLERKSNEIFAKESAVNLVSFGMNSEKMLRDKLYKKGFKKASIDYAVNFCKEYRLIDDSNYAKTYLDIYKCKYGSLKLKNELKNKGITDEIADELLSGIKEEDEVSEAIKIGVKYAKKLKIDEQKDKQKLMRYLLSKGFKYEIVKEVFKAIGNGDNLDTDDLEIY